jgi:signal transduction histidine kinase
MIVQSSAVIDSLADEIRTISNNLAPASLRKFGLETAMEEQIRKAQIDDRFHINFIRMTRGGQFDENLQLAIFRIFQELLTNSLKHSNATEISVQLIEHEEDVSFTIEDDGVGFNFNEALKTRSGNGLHNIISRVSLIGGKLQFDSSPGSGTTVTIQIPTNGTAHA